MQDETCENCGKLIGKHKQAFVYKGHIVCEQCDSKLREPVKPIVMGCAATPEVESAAEQDSQRSCEPAPAENFCSGFDKIDKRAQEIMYCPKCGMKNDANAFRCVMCREVIQLIALPQVLQNLDDDPMLRMLLPVGRSALAMVAGYAGLVVFLIFAFAIAADYAESLAFLILPAPVAFILAIIAIGVIRKNPTKHGMGRAIFGLITGLLGTALLTAIIVSELL